MLTIGQIGCGYWGPNLLRNFNALTNVNVKMVAELDEQRRNYIIQNYPHVEVTQDYSDILHDSNIDAIVIATPAETHFKYAVEVLQNNKHCYVEKPLAMNVSECQQLISLAEENNLKLMVGHTFLYNAAVNYLRKAIHDGELGDIYYIYSHRLNLGRVRQDINAMWNLAPHDISIVLYLLDKKPIAVSAQGTDYIQSGIEDVVFLTINFDDRSIAHIHVSWLDPNKTRKMTVVGTKKMIVYDDIADNKIQIFDKGIDKSNIDTSLGEYDDFGKFQLIHRAGDIWLPKINFIEPLKNVCSHFADCILNDKPPLTDGYNGLMVTKILESAQLSLKNGGEKAIL